MEDIIKNLESRIIELETKYSHQDELLTQLNLLVANQAMAIDQMSEKLKQLTEANSKSPMGSTNLKDEVPPHY